MFKKSDARSTQTLYSEANSCELTIIWWAGALKWLKLQSVIFFITFEKENKNIFLFFYKKKKLNCKQIFCNDIKLFSIQMIYVN